MWDVSEDVYKKKGSRMLCQKYYKILLHVMGKRVLSRFFFVSNNVI